MKKFCLVIALIVLITNVENSSAEAWHKAAGPNGPNVSSILALANDVILASTTSDMPETFPAYGILKSTDGGATWSHSPQNTLSEKATISLFKKKDGHLLCSSDGMGLMESTDNGETWNNLCHSIGSFSGLAEANNGDLLCYDWFSVKRSTDGGKTFNKIQQLGGAWGIDINSNGVLYALVNKKGVWKSTDNGVNWQDVSGTTLTEKDCRAICVDKKDNIWVSTWNNFFFSSDGGVTWSRKEEGLADFAGSPKGTAIVEDPNSDKMYICFSMTGGIMTYDESLSKWIKFSPTLPLKSVEAIAFTPQGRMLVGDHSVGIAYTDDNGATWTLPPMKVGEKMIYELAAYQDELYIGTGDGMVYRSVGENGDFTPILFPSEIPQAFVMGLAVTNQGTILVGRSGGGFNRSTDKGVTWTDIYSIAKILPETFLIDGNKIYAGSRGSSPRGVSVSLDDGLTWTQETGEIAGKDIFSIGKSDQGDIFAGTGRQGLFIKPIATGVWAKTAFPDTLFIYGLEVDSQGTLFVGTADGYVYKSSDNGATFSQISSDTKVLAMTMIGSEYHFYKDDIFFATEQQCAYMNHVDNKVVSFSEDFEGIYTRAILFQPEQRRLYAGGMTGGLQWYDLTVISAEDKAKEKLSIFPNPASDFISLSALSAAPGERIEIYTQLGVKVLEAASSTEKIDVSALPAGVYFLKTRGKVGRFIKV